MTLLVLVVNICTHGKKFFDTTTEQSVVADLSHSMFDLDVERTRAVVTDFVDWNLELLDQVVEHKAR